ncbi:HNH nuclease domain-containing protein [Vibrio crassostreae]|nr:conserved hypothetical protein [Vibrio chagasii]CAH6873889.1 conserved hypothetical protein [Vibrio chagasii]CAK2014886.1 HNH nuclease domain-containing protein [Vibrio crassostreae]
MNPYLVNSDESQVFEGLQNKNLSAKEMWEDDCVTDIKLRMKKHYISEQGRKCAYCKVDLHTNHGGVWDTEHIIDKDSSPQWTFEPLNLCVSCKDCNQAKGTRSVTKSLVYKSFPKSKSSYRIVHPHFDKYEDHIEVAVSGVTYRYKSKKGRETIEVCGLLRYHAQAGRTDVDPTLQAVLHFAGDRQTPETLKNVLDLIADKLGIDISK